MRRLITIHTTATLTPTTADMSAGHILAADITPAVAMLALGFAAADTLAVVGDTPVVATVVTDRGTIFCNRFGSPPTATSGKQLLQSPTAGHRLV